MDGHGLYFVGYAAMATISGIIIAWAQYSRKKAEGIDFYFQKKKANQTVFFFLSVLSTLCFLCFSSNNKLLKEKRFLSHRIMSINGEKLLSLIWRQKQSIVSRLHLMGQKQ